MDIKAISNQITTTSKEAFDKVAETAGLTQEKAKEALEGVIEQVQAGTASAAQVAENVAKKIGAEAEQVKAMLPYFNTVVEENAAKAQGAAKEAFENLKTTIDASPIGGFLKGLDKDGDGQILDDITDSIKGLFGKK